jgi:hypothetical protein
VNPGAQALCGTELGWSLEPPLVNNQLIVDPYLDAIIGRGHKRVIAGGKVKSAFPANGEMVGTDGPNSTRAIGFAVICFIRCVSTV